MLALFPSGMVLTNTETRNRVAAKLYTGWADIAPGSSNGGVVGVMVGCRTPSERSPAFNRAAGDAFPLIRQFLSSDQDRTR